ncbi:MAG: 3-oxoadipate enol-lactonase [Rhodobacteraceae bacterium]|nr:3-oxoadipate enol-lactonase [Paracoccaceae bacterium]
MQCLTRPWGHLHFRGDGPKAAPALVFANSLGTDLRMWDAVVALLPQYRCIRFDKRGHGLSACPVAPWSIADLGGDVIDLMDHLGVARAVVIGCSVGGMIAQSVAAQAPGRVAGLVLSNSAAKIGTAEAWQARMDAVQSGGMTSIAEAVLDRWFPASLRTQPQALPWLTMLQRCDAAGYIGTCRVLADTDLCAAAATLSMPALVLAGSEDQATPVELVRAFAQTLPQARLQVLDGSGHIPAIDAPGATAALIKAFLTEIGPV